MIITEPPKNTVTIDVKKLQEYMIMQLDKVMQTLPPNIPLDVAIGIAMNLAQELASYTILKCLALKQIPPTDLRHTQVVDAYLQDIKKSVDDKKIQIIH